MVECREVYWRAMLVIIHRSANGNLFESEYQDMLQAMASKVFLSILKVWEFINRR